MSVRLGLLALLAEGPNYGYDLRTKFESASGGTWALNVGQVYITLARLERDKLVETTGEADNDDERRKQWVITEKGRRALDEWFATPVASEAKTRDELAMKVALASEHNLADSREVLDVQRDEALRHLRAHTHQKAKLGDTETAQRLVLDSLIFHAEAEIRWLDHCEQQLPHQEGRS